MLRFCVRTFVNNQLKQTYKSYKRSRFKHRFPKNFWAQPNLTFLSAPNRVLHFQRKIHTGQHLRARVFKDVENIYAYNILQTIPVTDRKLFALKNPNNAVSSLEDFNSLLDQNWRSKSASEVVEGFKSALDYSRENSVTVSDTRFDRLVDGLMDRVQDLTDSELSDLLLCLSEFPPCDSYTAHNFHDIWSALDDVCCWKIANWPQDTLFLFAEHWYRLRLGKFSDFLYFFLDRMLKRADFLSKDELVHLYFYHKVHKRRKLAFEYQDALDRLIGGMSLQEVAVVAMTLARFATKIKLEGTTASIIKKLKQELLSADEICVRRIVEVRKVSKYTAQFVEKMTRSAAHLTKTQLVHIFFYINVCRKRYVDFNFENVLEKHVDELTADEMAIVAMGFFKSQTSVRMKFLLGQMVQQIKEERRTVHEITLTAILKILRYSTHVLLVDQLIDLLDHIVPEMDRLSCLCGIHIALLGTTLQFFHEKSLEKASQKIMEELSDPSQVRLKDMERLLLALTMFNFNPTAKPDIFESILAELQREERRKEFIQYPRALPCTLNYLSFRKIYSYALMDELLNRDSFIEIYGKSPKGFSRDLFSLDVSIDVECPDYRGNRLDKIFRHKVTKWFVEYTPSWNQHKKLTAADRFYLEVLETVAKVVQGHHNLHTEHVLPNYVKSDIIICQDQSGNFVQPVGFDNYQLGDVMRPPNPNLKWFAIIPLNWNSVIRNTTTPLGLMNMKCRQLKAIGYEPVTVIWSELKDLDEREKAKYILQKLNNCKL